MPKPSSTYLIIRLPQDRSDVIGETVTLYETEHEGRQAFLIVVGKKGVHPVIHPQENDAHPEYEKRKIDLEKRIRKIENVANTNSGIETALLSKREVSLDGPVEIRTRDLRHVKATS